MENWFREVKNQAELARIKGISRARVTQVSNLLKLNPHFSDEGGGITAEKMEALKRWMNLDKNSKY